jgi:glycosyltransferase involved in cell wall biosynthesis
VVDNASTDDTGAVVASYGDDRIRYVRHDRNIGANGNFNACLDEARGTYFLLLHDDDSIDHDFVEHCIAALERAGSGDAPGLIRTGNRVMDADSVVVSERLNRAARTGAAGLALDWFDHLTSMYFCNTMYLTSALRSAGGFRSPRELFIDVAAVFRIAASHPVLNVPEVKASFRRHGGNNGTAQSLQAWCDDSLFLIDLVCTLEPGQAAAVRSRGLRYFARNNYSRAARIRAVRHRLRAYWTVYRAFGFRLSPLRFVAFRWYQETISRRRSPSRA